MSEQKKSFRGPKYFKGLDANEDDEIYDESKPFGKQTELKKRIEEVKNELLTNSISVLKKEGKTIFKDNVSGEVHRTSPKTGRLFKVGLWDNPTKSIIFESKQAAEDRNKKELENMFGTLTVKPMSSEKAAKLKEERELREMEQIREMDKKFREEEKLKKERAREYMKQITQPSKKLAPKTMEQIKKEAPAIIQPAITQEFKEPLFMVDTQLDTKPFKSTVLEEDDPTVQSAIGVSVIPRIPPPPPPARERIMIKRPILPPKTEPEQPPFREALRESAAPAKPSLKLRREMLDGKPYWVHEIEGKQLVAYEASKSDPRFIGEFKNIWSNGFPAGRRKLEMINKWDRKNYSIEADLPTAPPKPARAIPRAIPEPPVEEPVEEQVEAPKPTRNPKYTMVAIPEIPGAFRRVLRSTLEAPEAPQEEPTQEGSGRLLSRGKSWTGIGRLYNNMITMSKGDFIKEHKRLIDTLENPTRRKLHEEAMDQRSELKKYRVRL